MADLDFVQVNNESTESDPAADFLAREQENLAGLEDEFENHLNVGSHKSSMIDANDFDHVSEQDPLNGEYVNGSNGYSVVHDAVTAAAIENKVEPEKIRIWREEQTRLLDQKDAEEERKKEELREQAKKELDEWYTRYAEQLEKSKLNNREASKNAEQEWIAERDAEQPGQDWEKITKLCDFNPKAARNTKDTSRMRSILLQLKQNPPATTNLQS